MTGLNRAFVSVDTGHDPASRIQKPKDIAPISVKTEKSPHRETHLIQNFETQISQQLMNFTSTSIIKFTHDKEMLGTAIKYLHCWTQPSLRSQERYQNSSQYSSHSPEAY